LWSDIYQIVETIQEFDVSYKRSVMNSEDKFKEMGAPDV